MKPIFIDNPLLALSVTYDIIVTHMKIFILYDYSAVNCAYVIIINQNHPTIVLDAGRHTYIQICIFFEEKIIK